MTAIIPAYMPDQLRIAVDENLGVCLADLGSIILAGVMTRLRNERT